MILEVADIRVSPSSGDAFEQAVKLGIETIISKAKGFRNWHLRRSIESPERYLLFIEWETLEDHTVGFRSSDAYAAWRAVVGAHFASPPSVEHFTLAAESER